MGVEELTLRKGSIGTDSLVRNTSCVLFFFSRCPCGLERRDADSSHPAQASPEQKQKLVSQFERKIEFNRKIKGPIWNGEFGPVYAADGSEGAEEINKARYHLLRDQMEIYEKHHASFSIWLFKDVGLQGMTYVDPETPYMKLFKDFIDKKKVGMTSVLVGVVG
jgi:hypothetical protein